MSIREETGTALGGAAILLSALSLSVGWGIRGNFGHEFGAMIPGALAAMAVVLGSARDDWWRRVAYFAMFGAIGWSFGGSISYMQVLSYTHSGHSPSVLYGFAGLFVIGFLWAALGGAGTALPAILNRDRLTELIPPMTAVFVVWALQDLFLGEWLTTVLAPLPAYLHDYDTDWLGALTAIVTALGFAALRRRIDRGTSLVLYLGIGWWAGFGILVLVLGLRMTPPRGDNWAGCTGMTLGLLAYCRRHRLAEVANTALISGFLGGIGFAAASMLKLVEVTSGLDTNWHSILEQSTGLFNGLAIAVAMSPLVRRAPKLSGDPAVRRWTEPYAVAFVLLLVTYVNFSKNTRTWTDAGTMPKVLYGLSARAWFALAYALLAPALVVPLIRHLRRPLPIVPASWFGRGQLLYLVFLWWVVVGNFERAVVHFTPERIVTEWVIFANAVVCTLLLFLALPETPRKAAEPAPMDRPRIRKVVLAGLAVSALSIVLDWGIVRAIYGDRHAGYSALNIRFGPNATTQRKAETKPAR
jgi:hypothetical protein